MFKTNIFKIEFRQYNNISILLMTWYEGNGNGMKEFKEEM